MNPQELIRLSKFLSYVLRHRPESIGLTLDDSGWAEVSALLEKANASGKSINLQTLKEIVKENDKQRFGFNEDNSKIRARQGHSKVVKLGLEPIKPPNILYHGTAEQNLASIRKSGLTRQNRQHVHLSDNKESARKIGIRHGKPVVLQIEAGKMHEEGSLFYLSENGVWLTEEVPVEFVQFLP